MNEKILDSDILDKIAESMKTDVYDFGAYYDFNGLDVKNIKNEIVEAIKGK